MTQLLPCPFCQSTDCAWTWNGSNYFMCCYTCHAMGPQVASFQDEDSRAIKECIEKWNNAERRI